MLSVAVHVMLCELPISQDSPPLGAVTVTTGGLLSIATVPALLGMAASGRLPQSRSCTDVTVTVPVPPVATLVTATLNRLPVCAVGPQLAPNTAPSTV